MSDAPKRVVRTYRPCFKKIESNVTETVVDELPERLTGEQEGGLSVTGGDPDHFSDEERDKWLRQNRYVFPFLSGIRNHFSARGGRVLTTIPTALQPLVNNNKNVGVVNSHDLESINGMLSAKSQIDLGYRYANKIKNISNVNISKYNPTIWIDAFEHSAGDSLDRLPNKGSAGEIVAFTEPTSANVVFNEVGINEKPAYKLKNMTYVATNAFGGESGTVAKYVFFVAKPYKPDAREGKIFMSSSDSARFLCHFPWDDGKYTAFDYAKNIGGSRVRGPDIAIGHPYIVCCALDGKNGFAAMRVNGHDSSIRYDLNFTSPNAEKFYIGGGGQFYQQDCELGEMIVCNTALGLSVVKDIEKYLSDKWDIPLSANFESPAPIIDDASPGFHEGYYGVRFQATCDGELPLNDINFKIFTQILRGYTYQFRAPNDQYSELFGDDNIITPDGQFMAAVILDGSRIVGGDLIRWEQLQIRPCLVYLDEIGPNPDIPSNLLSGLVGKGYQVFNNWQPPWLRTPTSARAEIGDGLFISEAPPGQNYVIGQLIKGGCYEASYSAHRLIIREEDIIDSYSSEDRELYKYHFLINRALDFDNPDLYDPPFLYAIGRRFTVVNAFYNAGVGSGGEITSVRNNKMVASGDGINFNAPIVIYPYNIYGSSAYENQVSISSEPVPAIRWSEPQVCPAVPIS